MSTKVCLVKAMVFPGVMYGCESWTVKKAEHRRINAFELWCWRRLLRVPWTAAPQASLSITKSWSLPKLMSIESVMPSNRLILCRPFLLLPTIPLGSGSFPMSQLFESGGQSIGVSASASVLPMNNQDWSPLGWSGWISLQSKGLSSAGVKPWWIQGNSKQGWSQRPGKNCLIRDIKRD